LIITKDWLNKHNACKDEVIRFCEVYPCGEAALNDVIQRLERADWLLWLLGHTGTPHREMVRLACLCARRALRYVPEGEMRPLRAIEAAERWVASPTDKTAAEAARAAEAAWAAWVASPTDKTAAEAAGAAEAAWAAWVASRAAEAAEHLAMCEMIRREIK